MSLVSIQTGSSLRKSADNGSNLPIEIWQIILRHLKARDLCHICCVCRKWRDVVLYVDSARWKELYSLCTDWKHPNWPLDTTIEPLSWKDSYRDQYLANRFWQNGSKDFQYMTCLTVLKRTKMKKVINVGPGEEHESLRSALTVANDYDQICVHPGIYDEQFEMSSKIPFEIIGCGELGSVILVVCIEQIATTGRLSNLVLRAPWFTSFILKIRSGFIQIDNCILEDGMLYIQNPGSCHVRFSSFRHASIILQHVNASIIENCEFCQSDTADIIVEGHVKEEKNWTFSYLQRLTERFVDSIIETNSDLNEINQNYESDDRVSNICDVMEDKRDSSHVMNAMIEKMSSVGDWIKSNPIDNRHGGTEDESSLESISDVLHDLDSITDQESRQSNHVSSTHSSSSSSEESPSIIRSESEDSVSDGSVIMLPHLRHRHSKPNLKKTPNNDNVSIQSDVKPLRFDLRKNSAPSSLLQQIKGCLIHHCRMTYSKGGVMVSLQGEAIILECDISNVSYGIRCIQNAQVIILKNKIHHCRTSGIFMRLASLGLIAGNDIYCNLEAGIDVRKNADPVIQYNKIHNGKRSGIVVLGSGRGHIQFNDIYENKEAGIYVLYGGNPLISGNNIYNGQAAGIAVNEGGKGLITGIGNNIYNGQAAGIAVNEGGKGLITENNITCNQWGAIDIRHDANPIIQDNLISNGSGDGIVIGEKGIGYLQNNVISGNAGCGIWIMNGNKPYLNGNQISCNGDCGIMLVDKSDDVHEETRWMVYSGQERHLDNINEIQYDSNIINHDSTTLEYNNIFQNHGRGIHVQYCDEVIIRYNNIDSNHSDGVYIDQDLTVELVSNNINNNKGSGIITSNSGVIDIEGNGIYNNKDNGIKCCNKATIYQNDVVKNGSYGISLHSCVSVNIIENRVHSVLTPAIYFDQVKNGVIENNIIFDHTSEKNDTKIFNREEFLKEPAARPCIKPGNRKPVCTSHYISNITRVTIPSIDNCPQGSSICTVL